jgi:signal transduction histidine kinase
MLAPRRIIRLAVHPLVQDVALATVLLVVSIAAAASSVAYEYGDYRPIDAAGYALIALAVLPVVARRRAPLTGLAVTLAAVLAGTAAGYVIGVAALALLVMTFSVAARRARRAGVPALLVVLGGVVAAIAVDSTTPESRVDYVANMTLVVVAWLLGDQVRDRRERIGIAEERADRAERERELVAERRVAEERLRIARELHDVIAHALSGIVVRAGAARTAARTEPEDLRRALGAVEDVARDALADARSVLGGLRGPEDDGQRAPQPDLGQLGRLVADSRAAGVPTELVVEGTPRRLAQGAELSAFRIVQEALTNVRTHAGPGARALVRLRYTPEGVEVSVEDDGAGAEGDRAGNGGHGVIGMRERAALLGGELSVGPRPGGGYAARARLPAGEGRGR